MKRIFVLVSAALITSCAGAQLAAAASTSSAATVQLRHTRLGSILTSSSGLTLYEFTRDRKSEDSCAKLHGCLQAWPALTSSHPIAGPGVKASLLSTIKLPDGARQVTYAGHALYTYEADQPGSTSYVGVSAFGGSWYALNASGGTVK